MARITVEDCLAKMCRILFQLVLDRPPKRAPPHRPMARKRAVEARERQANGTGLARNRGRPHWPR